MAGCPAFEFLESRAGYDRVLQQFHELARPHAAVHFHIRLDAAGQYATNLETFLRSLPFAKTLTVGEPARNQDYRKALFPKRKADPVESLCAARFALLEQPPATADTASAYYPLREIMHRLQGQVRQSTRLTNQLHNLLARVFPELALLAADLKARWVLQLLQQYPTPAPLARARRTSLTAIPFLTDETAEKIQAQAATTVASFTGETAATLVRQLVTQLRDSLVEEAQLHDLMAQAYRALPESNHLDSIPGVGLATAAVLTAKIVAIDRFAGPDQLVSYFGVFPQEDRSGLGKNGRGTGPCHNTSTDIVACTVSDRWLPTDYNLCTNTSLLLFKDIRHVSTDGDGFDSVNACNTEFPALGNLATQVHSILFVALECNRKRPPDLL